MKILYVTDLHGRTTAYEKTLNRALSAGADAIVNGGDLYPVGRDLFRVQREFIRGWFCDYLKRLARRGITFISTLGNMDLRGHDNLFREVMNEAGNGACIVDECAEVNGWTFVGSPMIIDAPFALKDRCLRDSPDSTPPPVERTPLLSDSEGIHEVKDWESEAARRPTLVEHLDSLPVLADPTQTVHVLHQPPHGLGLGIINSGADVGSRSVRDFLGRVGPRLSLHGHIHESPYAGGRWRSDLYRTACVQPGQLDGDRLVSVLIDLETLEMQREE